MGLYVKDRGGKTHNPGSPFRDVLPVGIALGPHRDRAPEMCVRWQANCQAPLPPMESLRTTMWCSWIWMKPQVSDGFRDWRLLAESG